MDILEVKTDNSHYFGIKEEHPTDKWGFNYK